MAKVTEIRVHGVSGTPARFMLRTDPVPAGRRPVPTDDSEPTEKTSPVELSVRDVNVPDHEVIAYNWSKLTSGRPRHALWLLLLPYTFINAAGWMLPPRQRGDAERAENEMSTTVGRWLDVAIRVSGGIVTALFTVFTLAVLIDLIAAKCQPGTDTCSALSSFPVLSPGWWLFISTVLALAVTAVIGIWVGLEPGRRKQSETAMERLENAGGTMAAPQIGESDPAARLTITDPDIWRHRPLTRYLVYTHMGISALAAGWVLTSIRRHTSGGTLSLGVMVAASIVVFGVLVLASSQKFSDRMPSLARLALGVGVAAWLVAVIDAFGLSDFGWSEIAVEEGISQSSAWLTLIITVVGLVVWLIGGLSKKLSTSGAAAMIVLGGLVGSAFGAGVYTLVQRALAPGAKAGAVEALPGMDWPAFLFLFYILILVGGALFTMAFGKLELEDTLASEGLRAVTTKVRAHLGWPAGIALAGAAWFVGWTFVRDGAAIQSPFTELENLSRVLIVGLSIAALAILVRVVHRYFNGKIALIAAAGIAILYLLISFGKITEMKALGASLRFDSLRELTLSVALLVPVGFIFSRLISTFRNREQRRGIAILWDLAGFWPRWYHPFGAPTYGPVAVPDLAALVREKAQEGGVILAAHSQGSVISMSALLTIPADDPVWDRIAYLTYGNPTCHLYSRLFGGHFTNAAISQVSLRLGGEAGGCTDQPGASTASVPRWLNLWRQSDPIGGDICIPGVASDAVTERIPDGHSAYEATTAFANARDQLKDLIS